MEVINAIGRRKSSIARVYLKEGTGKIIINKEDIEKYFPSKKMENCDTHAQLSIFIYKKQIIYSSLLFLFFPNSGSTFTNAATIKVNRQLTTTITKNRRYPTYSCNLPAKSPGIMSDRYINPVQMA